MMQRKLKIMWLCNCSLSDRESGGSGTWLGAMAHGLLDSGAVDLGIIAPGPIRQFGRSDFSQVKQWLVPAGFSLGRDGLPSKLLVQSIIVAVKEFSPDLIHVWGTEEFWGLLPARGLLTYPTLLEMQGLKGQIAKVFCGDLTLREQFNCIGVKELYHRRTMHTDRREFARCGSHEEEIIRGHRFVDVQSSWVAAHVQAVNPNAHVFPVHLALRQSFCDANGWQPPSQHVLFCIAASHSPYKGLHVAVQALAILRKRIPDVRLRIAGAHQRPGIRQDGYVRWINGVIRQLGLTDAIEWLGPLNAEQIVTELKNAAAVVIPTFIENCCTSMQETMAIGTPLVVSYAGGLSSLAKDEESALFFPPGDKAVCAYQLERVLTDMDLAQRLSRESRQIALVRNDRQRIAQRQLEIYRQVLDAGERCNSGA